MGEMPPITWSAFEYDYAYATTPSSSQGNCHDYDRADGMDGMYTTVSTEACDLTSVVLIEGTIA